MTGSNDRFESRVRAVFDEGVESIDGSVRSRLTQARYAAVAALGRPTVWRGGWVPAGALAAAAVLAVALWLQPDRAGQAPSATASVAALTDDFELLTVDDDLDMLHEDPEFYAWAAEAGPGSGTG